MEDEHATAHAEEAFFQHVMALNLSYFTNMEHTYELHWRSDFHLFASISFCDNVIYKRSPLCLHESPLVPFQVLPNASQEYDVTWYVSSSPCVACAAKLANILQQRKKVRLCILCSRLLDWEEPEIIEGLRVLASAGCKLRMMKPSDFVHVWETYVEKEEEQSFAPWEDCQENYNYYNDKLADILK